jgi:hypothetical protein
MLGTPDEYGRFRVEISWKTCTVQLQFHKPRLRSSHHATEISRAVSVVQAQTLSLGYLAVAIKEQKERKKVLKYFIKP